MVEVRGTPVVLVPVLGVGCLLGVVVEEPRLGGVGGADDVLEVALGVPLDLRLGVLVARARDEDCSVDDEPAQVLEAGLEAREEILRRPQVRREVLREGLLGELGRRPGAVKGRVDVEGAVGVVGALEGVYLAVLERLLAEGPAREVLGLGVLEVIYQLLV